MKWFLCIFITKIFIRISSVHSICSYEQDCTSVCQLWSIDRNVCCNSTCWRRQSWRHYGTTLFSWLVGQLYVLLFIKILDESSSKWNRQMTVFSAMCHITCTPDCIRQLYRSKTTAVISPKPHMWYNFCSLWL